MPARVAAAGARSASSASLGSTGGGGGDDRAAARKKKAQEEEKKRRQMEAMASDKRFEDFFAADEMGQDDIVVEVVLPEWVQLILAVTRITELRAWIDAEREERQKDTYQNPSAELFAIVTSFKFDCAVGFLILINAILIGVEASATTESEFTILSGVEHIFVFLFLVEWCMRVRAFGLVWVFELGNAADTFLVFGTGVIPKWLIEPMGVDRGPLRVLTVLRTLRLARIVRTVRLIPQMKELWTLVQGLLECTRPLLWTFCVGVVIIYIFAVVGTEIIGRSPDFADNEQAQEFFGDPMKSMFTLVQLITLDTWAYTIARPLMATDWYVSWFCVAFIMVAVFVFLNLVTAVIVENAMNIASEDMAQRAKDMDEQKKKDFKMLADLFLEIDEDGSGELSQEEFENALDQPQVQQLLTILELERGDMKDIWNVLGDGGDSLTIKGFTEGLRRMKGQAKAKDVVEIIKQLNQTAVRNADMKAQTESFNHTLSELYRDVDRLQTDTEDVLGLFQEMYERLAAHLLREEGEDRIQAKKRAQERELENQRNASEQPGGDEEEEEEDDDEDD